MNVDESLYEIKRYKRIIPYSITLPDPGEEIRIELYDGDTEEDSFIVIISRGSQTFDITLTQRWDLLCKRDDDTPSNIVRFDYAGAEHYDAGSYHVHFGEENAGGCTVPMRDMPQFLANDDLFIDLILPESEQDFEYDVFEDSVCQAIKGFLSFINCDWNDVQNLKIYY